MKTSSISLVFLFCAVLVAKLPGSAGDPVGSCPAMDGGTPVYLSDSVSCEYVEIQSYFKSNCFQMIDWFDSCFDCLGYFTSAPTA